MKENNNKDYKDFYNYIYSCGMMDGIAFSLATLKDNNIKCKELSDEFLKIYGEEHFSHKFHTQ